MAGPFHFTEEELHTKWKLSDSEVQAVKDKQLGRNPNWKDGDKFACYFADVSKGEQARPGNF